MAWWEMKGPGDCEPEDFPPRWPRTNHRLYLQRCYAAGYDPDEELNDEQSNSVEAEYDQKESFDASV